MLDPLSKKSCTNCEAIVGTGAIPVLIDLLSKNEDLQLGSTLVLQNISNQSLVRNVLEKSDVIKKLITILSAPQIGERLQWRCVVILSDMLTSPHADTVDFITAQKIITNHQNSMLHSGTVPLVVPLLTNLSYDLRLNACYFIDLLSRSNTNCQITIADSGAIPLLISLFQNQSHDIKVVAANALGSLIDQNHQNQICALVNDVIVNLVNLFFCDVPLVHNSAAFALEKLATDNCRCQEAILEYDRAKAGLARLLLRDTDTKISTLYCLVSIAGDKIDTQKSIAHFITISKLTDMLQLDNARLQLVCSSSLRSLFFGQSKFANLVCSMGKITSVFNVIQTAVRELKYGLKPAELVIQRLSDFYDTLFVLLIGPAMVPNSQVQTQFHEYGIITSLLQIFNINESTELLMAKSALCISGYVMKNSKGHQYLKKGSELSHPVFDFSYILELVNSNHLETQILSLLCISVLIFNNKSFESYLIKDYKLFIKYSHFNAICNNNQCCLNKCHLSFVQIILSNIIHGIMVTELVIDGIKQLLSLLSHSDEKVILHASNYLAALARTSDGIPATIIAAGVIDHLFKNLFHEAISVNRMTAVALSYLTFNGTGRRKILTSFRHDPYLCYMFDKHLSEGEICQKFKYDWEMTSYRGIPSLSLDKDKLFCKYKDLVKPPSISALNIKTLGLNLEVPLESSQSALAVNMKSPPVRVLPPVINSETTDDVIPEKPADALNSYSKLNIVSNGPLMKQKIILVKKEKKEKLEKLKSHSNIIPHVKRVSTLLTTARTDFSHSIESEDPLL